MKPLAAFIMRGPVQASLVAWFTGLLSLLLPLVGLLSSATLALVTLRGGTGYGIQVGALAGLGCLILCALLLGSPWPALAILLVLWLLGLVSSYTMGGFIHVLVVVAIVIILLRVLRGRKALG